MLSTKLIWFDPVVVVSTKAQHESAVSGIRRTCLCESAVVIILGSAHKQSQKHYMQARD
jgi:hypothetical protein